MDTTTISVINCPTGKHQNVVPKLHFDLRSGELHAQCGICRAAYGTVPLAEPWLGLAQIQGVTVEPFPVVDDRAVRFPLSEPTMKPQAKLINGFGRLQAMENAKTNHPMDRIYANLKQIHDACHALEEEMRRL